MRPSFLHLAETEWPHNVISSNDELTFKELVKNPPQSNLKECLNVRGSDQKEAENYWIHHVRAQSFTKALQYLKKQSSAATPVYIKQFGLFLDDEFILRCRGQINNSVLAHAVRNPIVLPSKHGYVNLLIADFHAKVKHHGVNVTLVALREKYWVI